MGLKGCIRIKSVPRLLILPKGAEEGRRGGKVALKLNIHELCPPFMAHPGHPPKTVGAGRWLEGLHPTRAALHCGRDSARGDAKWDWRLLLLLSVP